MRESWRSTHSQFLLIVQATRSAFPTDSGVLQELQVLRLRCIAGASLS